MMPDYQLTTPAQHPVITLVDSAGNPADLSGYIPSGTYVPAAGAATKAGVLTLTSAPVVPDLSFLQAKTRPLNIVAEGDSNSAFRAAYHLEWPEQIKAMLSGRAVITNVATGGDTVANMVLAASTNQVDAAFRGGYDNIAVWGTGANDQTATATTMETNYRLWATGRRAVGFRVILSTLTPRANVGVRADYESWRQDVNTRLRAMLAEGAIDGLVDVGAASSPIGAVGAQADSTYFNNTPTDLALHLNSRGHAVYAAYLRAELVRLGCDTGIEHYSRVERRNEMWVPASMWNTGSGAVTPPTATQAGYNYTWAYADAALQTATLQFVVPNDWKATAISIYWLRVSGAHTGDVRWQLDRSGDIRIPETAINAFGTPQTVVPTATATALTLQETQMVVSGGDATTFGMYGTGIFNLRLYRNGAHATDTFNNTCYFAGAMFMRGVD